MLIRILVFFMCYNFGKYSEGLLEYWYWPRASPEQGQAGTVGDQYNWVGDPFP